jgi:N-acyl-D-amino-acid deacylase
MSTVLLRNGKIIDGSGTQRFDGHVLIEDDRIKAILKQNDPLPQADISIDVNGCAIAPGFIDIHSHLEGLLVLKDQPKYLKCQLEQGITTVVGGNCGFSPAPVAAGPSQSINSYPLVTAGIDAAPEFKWNSIAGFFDTVEKAKPVINLALLVGHGTLRCATARTRHGAMQPDELQDCLKAVQHSFDEGACGLSFGLGYDPGVYSPNEEIEAFSRIAAKSRKPVTVHLRAYTKISGVYPLTYSRPHNIRALQEMIDIARHTSISLQVSHFVPFFRTAWPLAEQCIRMLDDARNDSVDIMADAIPYSYVNGIVKAALSPQFMKKLPAAYKSRQARIQWKINEVIGYKLLGYSNSNIRLMDAGLKGWEDMNGLTIDEIARRRNTSQWDLLLQLNELSDGMAATIWYNFTGDENHTSQIESILAHKLCLIGSDALIRGHGYPNPAAFGTFPKVLGYYSRDKKLFSMEEAVRKMTSVSAERFGLKERGTLSAGKAADIVIFDPKTIGEGASTEASSATRPTGIRHVFLNGAHVVKDGAYINLMRAGEVLRT